MFLLLAVVLAAIPTAAQEQAVAMEFDAMAQYPIKPGNRLVTITDYVMPEVQPTDKTGYLQMLIRRGICSSQMTVTGKVLSARSVLTPNKHNVFTIYEFQVEESLRGVVVAANTSLYVVRPGGSVVTPEGTYGAASSSHAPLIVDGHYLLFLTEKNGFFYSSAHDWRIRGDLKKDLISAHDNNEEAFPFVQSLTIARDIPCGQ